MAKKKSKLVKKTMPYTKEAMRAAAAWMEDSGTDEVTDHRDYDAVVESLAEAFHKYAIEAKS